MFHPTAIALAVLLTTTASLAQTRAIAVTDGDTIKVDGVSWRLMGFDTPETFHARCEEEYRLGIIATAALQKLIDDAKEVRPVTTGRRDRYDRILGKLYVDNKDVGPVLIAKGLAEPYDGRTKRRDWCR